MKKRILGIMGLIVIFLLPQNLILGSSDTNVVTEAQTQIIQINDEESSIIEALYKMDQEIKATEREENNVSMAILQFADDIAGIESKIDNEERLFDQNRDILGTILKSYQKRGAGTFIEIILDSDSLVDFLRRLNILRDLTHDTGELLTGLEDSKRVLKKEKNELADKVLKLESEQERLVKIIDDQKQLKVEQELYLVSLQEKRSFFENILTEINNAWDVIKPLFIEASEGFSRLAESGNLPPDALKFRLSTSGFDAIITEEAFNNAIMDNDALPEMVFDFEVGVVKLTIPGSQLTLSGNFEVENGDTLIYEATKGTFYDMPLDQNSMDELFENGGLRLNLKPLTGKNKIKFTTAKDDELVLAVQINLF